MNKKILSLIILFLGVFSVIQAQNDGKIRVKGVVLDETTRQPIAFANIGIIGTAAGAASDMDGLFELIVSEKLATYMMRVSAVGYASAEMKVYEARDKGEVQILLKPVTYGIGEVDVTAESLVLKKLLENVVKNIGRNYIPRPYNYEGYFEYGVEVNDGEKKFKEAIVDIYDSEGYKRSNVEQTFKALNYNFSQVRRSGESGSAVDGLIYFDDIITADIVRNTRNILDLQNFRDFKLRSKGKFMYEGDSVQIVTYECLKPSLSNSGTANVTKFSGELYVELKSFAIIKNVMHVTSSAFNLLGRNLLLAGDSPRHEVMATITTNYKRVSSYYFLSGVSIVYTYKDGGDRIKGEMQYQTTKVSVNKTTPITGRVYYEEVPTDHNFWDRYTIYLEEEE